MAGNQNGPGRRHAVVIGGGMAGMLAARVLSRYADRVTLVERDRWPNVPAPRPGLPQSRHVHVLLPSGRRALEELLPGTVALLRERGARLVGMPRDMVQWQSGRWYRRFPASTHLFACTGTLLDATVREQVAAAGGVDVVEGTQVVGLLGDARRVTGVRLRARGATDAPVRELAADLVVDASGRSSPAPDWLAELGADRPREESIDTGLAYASRLFRLPEGQPDPSYDCLYVLPDARQPLTGVVLRVEDGRWFASLAGPRGSRPPTDEEGLLDFASRYPHPHLRDWISAAVPDSPVYGARRTANVRRHYAEGRTPAGFLAMGDALCTFNPIYGQGMAVAALGALALRDALADPSRVPSTRRVQRALAAVAGPAWDISAGADRAVPGAELSNTRQGPLDALTGRYLARIQQRVPGDRVLGDAYRKVLTLQAPPSYFFRPRVAVRALRPGIGPTPAEPPFAGPE
ncbi:FAD-dependent oxidoreductase [Streptomyces sp. NPDC007088]|uniref:FAD-dependent oxidoreductase n=1 Tax=Streptomyces sp. NPDC007088 TaxID=3364773 RepID=UPI0036D084A4